MSTTTMVPTRIRTSRVKTPATHEENEHKRRLIYADGEFNTRVRKLIESLENLQADLRGLHSCHVCGSIENAWKKAGLPKLTADDEEGHETLQAADEITFDASGFLWAIRSYLSTLESFVATNFTPKS